MNGVWANRNPSTVPLPGVARGRDQRSTIRRRCRFHPSAVSMLQNRLNASSLDVNHHHVSRIPISSEVETNESLAIRLKMGEPNLLGHH
jgi:hypothetical protein